VLSDPKTFSKPELSLIKTEPPIYFFIKVVLHIFNHDLTGFLTDNLIEAADNLISRRALRQHFRMSASKVSQR